eukprot:scaffold645891_cov34-Prasinocladus_malaysianus.AAC.1
MATSCMWHLELCRINMKINVVLFVAIFIAASVSFAIRTSSDNRVMHNCCHHDCHNDNMQSQCLSASHNKTDVPLIEREQVLTRDSFVFRVNEVSEQLYFVAKARAAATICIFLNELPELVIKSQICSENSFELFELLPEQGAVEFVVEQGNEVKVTAEAGVSSVVGELSFFFGMPQSCSARSKLNCPGATLYVLNKENFKELSKLYPEQEEVIIKK